MSYDRPARHVKEYLNVLLPLVREGRVDSQVIADIAAWIGQR